MKARPAIPLFVGAALLSALTMLNGIQPNDEGLMLQAASRIAHGQVPYKDFWWFYPPGQPYLLAALWKVFGPSLLTWRIVRVLTDAAVATLAYLLARRAAPPKLALAAWLAAACAMAFPSGPHPYPIAMACALGALLLFEERPLLAGLLVGVCAAWRLEFAAYLGVGIVVACLVGRRSPLRFAGSAAGVGLVLYLPVVIAAGIGRSWDLIVKYPLTTFSDYQSLPFPTDYNGPLNTSSIGGFFTDSAENILHYYVPLALVVGLGAAVVALALRWGRERWWQIASVIFAGGMAHYLVVRADEFHTAPLAVMLSVLAAWVLAERRALPKLALVPAGVVALAFVYVLAEGLDRRVRTAQDRGVAINLPVADGVRDRAARVPPLENAVRYVDAHVPRGRPIYVATLRSDLITSGNPLFYVFAQRPNPTRYDIQAPGVVTSAPVQREIVGDLERTRTPIVVRFAAPITAAAEPDRAGRSTGVHVLDDYIAQRYHRVAKYAFYEILARNG